MKKTSVTRKMRSSFEPNLTLQDIAKEPLFCNSCEELMCKEEKYFAETLFYPLHDKNQTKFEYNYHLGRFCVIQSFRILVYFDFLDDEISKLRPSYSKLCRKAINLYRDLILSGGKKQNEFSNHIFLLDLVSSVEADLPKIPKRFNFWSLRSIEADIIHSSRVLFTYTKMCKIVLMSFFVPRKPEGFKGTRVYAQGTLKIPQGISFPGFGEFLFDRARKLDSFYEELSPRQRTVISQRYARNKSKMISSESWVATKADSELGILERIRQSE